MAVKTKRSSAALRTARLLMTGIEMERKGAAAYLKFAFASKSLTGKNMFIRLASDELEHMQILENIRAARLGKKPFRKPPLPMKQIEDIMPKLHRPDLLVKGQEGLSDLDALEVALEMERKSADYYKQLGSTESDKKLVELASDLARWEEFHHDLLQGEIDFIRNTGVYFDILERQMSEKY